MQTRLGRRIVVLALKVLLSSALIVYVATRVDLGLLLVQLRTIHLGQLALAGGVFLVQIVIGAVRWRSIILFMGAKVALLRTVRIYYIGVFFNMCTPGGLLGDAVRIWHAHRAGLTLPFAIGSVILDRIAVVLSLILATTLLQYFLPAAVRSRFQIVGSLDLLSLLAIISIAGVGVLIWLDKLPASLQSRMPIAGLLTLSLSARRIFLNPAALASVLLLAVTSQAFVCLAIYTLARSLDIGIGLLDCMILMPPVILLSLLPVSIGGWGVRESVMVFVLGLIGIASEQALLLSVLLGLAGMAISLPGWILWMTAPLDINPDSGLRMRTASPQSPHPSSTGE
jgi:glycosyltransferase 2 family protein